MFEWGHQQGLSLALRRAEAFNVLVFSEIGYSITTRFIKVTSFSVRTLTGNPWCWVSIAVTAALQVLLTYVPGLNWFFSMPEGMLGIQWARVVVCMVVVYITVEVEKALVDPVLMPVVRPVLDWIGAHTPSWLHMPKLSLPDCNCHKGNTRKERH
eukprot:GHRR01022257.1.p1 GENE.GHRR01022257.1~~GHRR01022257.1.p1  ORF type:complete len:155 (+),score=42.35 GHRR01022257.1:185-649(+)